MAAASRTVAGGAARRSAARPRALQAFLDTEAGGAAVLLGATVLALGWANSPLAGAYEALWSLEVRVGAGAQEIRQDLRHWVNDGLMVVFFFVVGLEVRRELSMGELTGRHAAALPVLAALGGIAVPAAVFLAFNAGEETARGWGIAMATDTAFVLGALALLGRAVPAALRAFVLTLAIVDDIAAIAIIAVFYSGSVDLVALAAAAGLVLAWVAVRTLRVWRGPAYLAVGGALWVATLQSGLHPVLAGVALGLLTPVYEPARDAVERAAVLARAFCQAPTPALARSAVLGVGAAISPNERLQAALHPWTSYVVVPLFALANAGLVLDGDVVDALLGSPLTHGIVAGLVAGKLAGISLACWLAVRLGLGRLPRGVDAPRLAGGAALAGIGFTVSLLVADLAFDDPRLHDEAKAGVLAASVVAAALGALWLLVAARRRPVARPSQLEPPVDPQRDHVRGPVDAPLELVEFSDYECAFCGRMTGVVDELRERFGDRLRYVVRHLPLSARHPHAQLAAEAAEAAAAQGRFWEMHDLLFAHQHALELDDLVRYADRLGLDVGRFVAELRDGTYAARVAEDAASAAASGAHATPTFFVNGRRHRGPYDAVTLAAELEGVGVALASAR